MLRCSSRPQHLLCVDNFGVYDFRHTVSHAVHSTDPRHHIIGFQLFGYAFGFRHLLYQPREHLLRLPVNIHKVTVQPSARQQVGIKHSVVFFQILPVQLSPYSNRLFFCLRQRCPPDTRTPIPRMAAVPSPAVSSMADNSPPAAHTKARSSRQKCTYPFRIPPNKDFPFKIHITVTKIEFQSFVLI